MKLKALTAFAALAIASPVAAQTAVNTADPYATTTPVEEEDDDFPWGLLGLLGLAGLMGLKRRDDRDDHRTTTTGTTNR